MPRKMLAQLSTGSSPLLTEVLAENEEQLQTIMKENPDLLPVDEFGMIGPLLVVGRETTLASGYVDLVCLTRGGDLLIAEFKTGPQNPDFRHALAQLLDYGSDLWGLSYDEFESTVVRRYFSGNHCHDPQFQGQVSLEDAARTLWRDLTDEETALFRERVTQQLTAGDFHYLVVAQKFTATMERTIEYLNAKMSAARFYAVELVRFAAPGISAYESRTVLKPASQTGPRKPAAYTNEAQFLVKITDEDYQEALTEIINVCHGLKLKFEWGAVGTSIRLVTTEPPHRLTIGWLFPPSVSGWQGLLDLNLGFDPGSADKMPSLAPQLEAYLDQVEHLPGAEPVKPAGLRAYHLTPQATITNRREIANILADLVQQASAAS